MRGFAALSLVLAFGCANGTGTSATPPPAPDLTGVWAVTMRYEDGSCADLTGGSQASMWTVNRDGDGKYKVSVQGDEAVPTLTGAENGSEVVLVGLAGSYPSLSTQWKMGGTATELNGRAIQTRTAKDAAKVKTVFGESTRDVMCSVIWKVQATKQGK